MQLHILVNIYPCAYVSNSYHSLSKHIYDDSQKEIYASNILIPYFIDFLCDRSKLWYAKHPFEKTL